MATVTVSIGRNVGAEPMTEHEWAQFVELVRLAVKRDASAVFVDAAASVGEWEGIAEESRTWVADIDEFDVLALRNSLRRYAVAFGQDAIALTVGTTELVGA